MLHARPAIDRTTLTEPIAGWRTWTIAGSRDGTEVVLLPIAGTGKPWPPRLPVAAECAKGRHHPVPGLDCTCGIHATLATDRLRRTRDPAVLGRVALWGRVLEHEHGFRAEQGYPQRLALICQLCFWQWGAEHSNPPDVVVRRRGGRLVPLCEPHLELCRRYGYPARHLLAAGVVERALLDAYAVDVLRLGLRRVHSGG
ncbi:MAG: hypothetical protein ACXWXK_04335 [Actinomycetota bacterium]